MSIELQNAFKASRSFWLANRKPHTRIAAALEAGRFVVVEEYPVYCPHTDAIMGSEEAFIADFETRDEAEAHRDAHNADESTDIERWMIKGPVFYGPVAPVPDTDTGCPF